jgi:tRNA(fMet)-specific endonuclease VapC
MIKYMLDTNIAIYVIKHKPIHVLNQFNRHANQMCLSMMSVSELLHGAEKSQFPEKTLQTVEDFISRLAILDYDYAAASQYGDIRAKLERKGTPIGVNDLHIAAHARSRGLILVTNNLREFERVEGLRIENWF